MKLNSGREQWEVLMYVWYDWFEGGPMLELYDVEDTGEPVRWTCDDKRSCNIIIYIEVGR